MPLIARPADDAEKKINTALLRLDVKVRKAAADCKKEGGKDSTWERNVEVTMAGPRFISYLIVDNAYCGGAHPDVSEMAIVYDLTTGAPVDWTSLLPHSLTGDLALIAGDDGTKTVTLSGYQLYARYLRGYRPRTGDKKKDAEDDDCREAVKAEGDNGGVPGMSVWLDAKQKGLVVQLPLPHVDAACSDDVTIPLDALRSAEAQPVLIDALTKAHVASRTDGKAADGK